MDLLRIFELYLLKVVLLLLPMVRGQILMEELREFRIDPLDLNGTEPYTDLTIDQIIMRASGGPGMAQNLMLGANGTVLAELDMYLTADQFNELYDGPQSMEHFPGRGKRSATGRKLQKKTRSKRKAIRDVILRWKDSVVPYKFVTGHFQDKEEYMIKVAMTEWEKYTCVRFRPAKYADRNLVRFQNGYGCNSQLGMVGGEQALNLDRNGCRFKGLYLHEIGHALGLVHEHQLPDRDKYIEILYHNVQPNMRIWFNKYSSQEVNQMSVPYEYSSVMHYGITAFSSDGQSQTIRSKQPDKEESIGRVYKKELSFSDVKVVNLMYNCAKHCSPDIECNYDGYVDQNCKCVCPDGTDDCTRSKRESEDKSCFNAHDNWQCSIWANQGECNRNPRFMLDGCKKACHLCGNQDEESDECKDMYQSATCEEWKARGECVVNKEWMAKNCKKTCRACPNSGPDPEVSCQNQHTNSEECDKWASEGECIINQAWMPENCRKSCRLCDESSRPTTTPEPTPEPGACEDLHNSVECQGWAATDECIKNPDWMIPNCRKSCNKCGGDGGDTEQECKNIWDDMQCTGWARDQECMKNSIWMKRNCHKACSGCQGDTDGHVTDRPTVAPVTTMSSGGSCVNNHKSDKECETWAQYGHCKINKWMLEHCKKACKECTPDDRSYVTTASPDNRDKNKSNNDPTCYDEKEHCKSWAAHGFCEDNPGTALRICKRSCNACTTRTECFDKHQLCPVWEKSGQCQRNSGYMLRNCKKSCGMC